MERNSVVNELLLRRVRIRDVVFGEKTEVDNSILRINREELIRTSLEDPHLKSVEIKLAKPGEKKRIIPVKDIVEPRAKGEGTSAIFPGFLGTAEPVGTGMTYVLEGVAIVTCGRLGELPGRADRYDRTRGRI